jgi:hypothetical protein
VGPALFLASFAGTMLFNLGTFLPDQIVSLGAGFSILLAVVLDIALFMVLYFTLPHGASNWRQLLPGAIGAGLLWELAKKAFLFFVSTYISVSNMVYGSVAAIFAFLVWAYLSGLIFLFGAFISVAYYQLKRIDLPNWGSECPLPGGCFQAPGYRMKFAFFSPQHGTFQLIRRPEEGQLWRAHVAVPRAGRNSGSKFKRSGGSEHEQGYSGRQMEANPWRGKSMVGQSHR